MNEQHPHVHHETPVIAWLWLLTSVLVLGLIGSGRINNYVHTFWRPFLAVAAIFVLMVALSDLWVYFRGCLRNNRVGETALGQQNYKTPWFAWLLLAPILLVVCAAPSPLGAAMLANAVSGSDAAYPGAVSQSSLMSDSAYWQPQVGAKFQGGLDLSPLKTSGVNDLTLEQLSDRFNLGDSQQLWGKTVRVIGFVSHDVPPDAYGDIGQTRQPGQPAAGYQLNRFKIFCCAADAIAYSVVIVSDQDMPDNTWLQIEGRVVPDPSLNAVFLQPSKVERISQPEVPYL